MLPHKCNCTIPRTIALKRYVCFDFLEFDILAMSILISGWVPNMGLCKVLFVWLCDRVRAPSFKCICLCYCNIYLLYKYIVYSKTNKYILIPPISLASFQCNQNNFGK